MIRLLVLLTLTVSTTAMGQTPKPPVVENETQLELRQFYTHWWKDPKKDRFISFYFFKPNPKVETYQRQIIVFYPNQKEYTFYYNIEKNTYWGRCCTKHHAQYDPQEMVWNFAKSDGWEPLTKGDPAIPKSNDGAKMISPPHPPGLDGKTPQPLEGFFTAPTKNPPAPAGLAPPVINGDISLRQFYTPWVYEKKYERYVSCYLFKPDPKVETYKRQLILYYPAQEKYTYFFNPDKQKYWGRCCTKNHEQFRKDVMVWNFADNAGGWEDLTVGDPAIPTAVDTAKIAFPPDPPNAQGEAEPPKGGLFIPHPPA